MEATVRTGYVLTTDSIKICYDHYDQGRDKVVILAHGFFNSKGAVLFKEMAEALHDDYDVIAMDFRGHGQSQGVFSWTAKEFLDLQAILEYAEKHYEKIGVIGYSLGAATSIITAAKTEKMTSLIAVSPPAQFNKIDFHFWKMGIMENIVYNIFQEGRIGKGVLPGNLWLKKIRPIDAIADVKAPIFFIHGEKDWLIKPKHSEELYKKAQCRKRLEIIKNGTHGEYLFRNDRQGTIKLFKEWFRVTLN